MKLLSYINTVKLRWGQSQITDTGSRFSSSRIVFTGEFQEFHGVFALHGGEMFQEEFQRVPGSQIVEQGLRHHAGVTENQRSSEDAGIIMDRADPIDMMILMRRV